MLTYANFIRLFPGTSIEDFAHAMGEMDDALIVTPDRFAHFVAAIDDLDDIAAKVQRWTRYDLNEWADAHDRTGICKVMKPDNVGRALLDRLRRFALVADIWGRL